MVAPGTTTEHAPVTLSPVVQRMGWGPVAFTVDDALGMVAQGFLPEDSSVELLNGSLVHRDRFDLKGGEVVAGAQHDYVVTALAKLAATADSPQRHARSQTTLVCGERHAPIPDVTVLRGTLNDYRQRLPTAADAWCVVEVADSSYERDVGDKLQGYARAGVGQYVIINLRNRTAEVYANPDAAKGTYPPPQIVTEGDSLQLRVGEDEFLPIPLADILP